MKKCDLIWRIWASLNRKLNPKLVLSRIMAGGVWGQILATTVLFMVVCLLVGCFWGFEARNYVDMLSPVSLRNAAYDTYATQTGVPDPVIMIATPHGDKWRLIWLYLIGTVLFSGILVATITTILRTWGERFKNGEIRFWSLYGHTVFLGYNDMVPGMIEKMCGDGDLPRRIRIVIGVADNVHEVYRQLGNSLRWEQRKCVIVLKADSNNEWGLRKRMRVHKAKEVYIIGDGDDAYRMNSYKKIQEICRGKMPECYVEMQHQSTFALFQTYSEKKGKKLEHFHAFNFHDVWARQMVMGTDDMVKGCENTIDTRRNENMTADSVKHVHLVVIGMTEMGEALAREAAFLCHYPNYVTQGIRTKITFIDPQAMEQMGYFTGHYHHLFEHCKYSFRDLSPSKMKFEPPKITADMDFLDIEFEFIQANIADVETRKEIADWAKDKSKILTIAVCTDMPHRSMAAGLYLPDEVFENNIPVWVYQPAKGDLKDYLECSHFKNIITFGMSGKDLDIKNEDMILQAKRLNYLYGLIYDTIQQNKEKSQEEILDAVDSLVLDYKKMDEEKWNNLDVFKKWSNVYCVSTIKKKIDSVRGEWSENNIQLIDAVEHNRWNVEKLMMGFRAATDEERRTEDKDGLKQRFIHCDIRPYNDLDEETKKYDNKFTKEIPNIIKPI